MKIKNYDQTIEESNRRQKGEFYTPTIFVDYAHKMIEEQFGEDWREKYVVWDCAWGTGNLTRDYKFKELYCSTLEQAELDIAKDINKDATKFKFDFLNDDFEDLPEGLKQAFIEKKPILFLINPPYGGAGNGGANQGSKEKGVLKTKINSKMLEEGIGGAASQEFYAQFLYRIANLNREFNANVSIALFCNPKFMTGTNFNKFRDMFMEQFNFIDGIYFNAGHFANVSAEWGITFNIWGSSGVEEHNNFKHTIVDIADGNIIKINEKILYNLDNEKTCSEWIKEPIKGIKTSKNALQMKSALAWRDNGSLRGSIAENSIGYYYNAGNQIQWNAQGCFIVSSCAANGAGISILPDNFHRVCSNFAARRLIDREWFNGEDSYMVPDENHSDYNNFKNDSVVLSLFESKSQQSSLRNAESFGKLWNVKNEFFFMGRDEMMDLADNCGFDELYNDAKSSDERYVYNVLQDLEISDEAKAVLEKARDIVRKSFKYRADVHNDHPEYHLNAWDAGWYQIKKLCSELPMFKEDMDEFKSLFKALKEKMRPMVYELGFLEEVISHLAHN